MDSHFCPPYIICNITVVESVYAIAIGYSTENFVLHAHLINACVSDDNMQPINQY